MAGSTLSSRLRSSTGPRDPLITCLRELPAKIDVTTLPFETTSRDEFARDAERHGLSALLLSSLVGLGSREDDLLKPALQRPAMKIVAGAMRARGTLMQVLEALTGIGIRPVLLKGYGFARRFYEEPMSRPTSDVDLLMVPGDLSAAENALRGLGFTPMDGPTRLYSREHHHHLTFTGASGTVELHFRALSDFGVHLDAEPLVRRGRDFNLDGQEVLHLCPEDEVVYLIVHAAHHLFARLSWLYDAKLLIQAHPNLNWEVVEHRSTEAGLAAAMYFGLDLLSSEFGLQIPESTLNHLRPLGLQVEAIRAILSGPRLVRGVAVRSARQEVVAKALLASGGRNAFKHLGHHTLRSIRRRLNRVVPGLTPEWWRG